MGHACRFLKKETLSKPRAATLLGLPGFGYPRPSSALASISASVRMLLSGRDAPQPYLPFEQT